MYMYIYIYYIYIQIKHQKVGESDYPYFQRIFPPKTIYSTLLGHRWLGWMAKKSSARSLDFKHDIHVGGFTAPSGIRIILIYQLQGIMTHQPPGTWSSFEILELDTPWLCTSKFATHIWPLMMHDATAWFFFCFRWVNDGNQTWR